MKRYFRVFRNRPFPLMTFVVLLAVTLGYYLFYVRGREVYFTHRYVRLLAFEGGRLEERLSTLESIFANYQKDRTLQAKDLKSLPGIERLDPPPEDFKVANEGITREERIEEDRFRIYTGWKQGADTVVYRFDPFVLSQPSPPPDFEVLFVARKDGTVLFQQGQNRGRELRIVNVKKLIGRDGKELDLSSFAQSTASLDVLFAGAPYKLFLRPCCRKIWKADPKASSLEWVVGGAVRTSTLSKRAWSISFTVAIILIAFFVLALLCLPFLRVLAMGPEEKLRIADALWVGLTAIVGVGLLTLLLLDLHAYQALSARIDGNLEALAGRIQANMKEELEVAWRQLDELNQAASVQIGPALAGATDCASIADSTARHREGLLKPREPFLWEHQTTRYSDFERFLWTDSEGRQCFKWALGEVTDPLVNDVKGRRYFQEAMNGRMAIEPVFSLATGSRVVALASKVEGTRSPFVGVLGIEMSSLNGPVLPQGYGFAVVDENGDVLFHSEPGRSGYENFFEEVDTDRELRALVYARRQGPLSTAYMGRGHRLWVEPVAPLGPPGGGLAGPPFWTLIVLSDKGEKRACNVDVVTTALLFLVLHLLVYTAGCWALRATRRRYRAGWLWPERKGEERAKRHLRLAVFYLLALIASLLAIRGLDGVDLLWFAYVFPWAVLLVSYRLCAGGITAKRRFLLRAGLTAALLLIYLAPLSGRPLDQALGITVHGWTGRGLLLALVSLGLWVFFCLPSRTWRFEPVPPRWIYEAAAALLLAITAAMPAAAFFSIAHRAHLETAIKRGQIELARGQEERDERLLRTYAGFQKKPGLVPGGGGLLQALVQARLQKTWDLYTDFFFGTTFEPVSTGPEALKPGEAQVTHAALWTPLSAAGAGTGEERWEPCMLPGIFEEILPLYNEDFVRVRRLIADHSGDFTRSWRHDLGNGRLQLHLGPSARLLVSSTIPGVSLHGARGLWPVSLLLLTGAVIGVARFVARKFFLLGLPAPEVLDPMNMASASTQSLVLVSPRIEELARSLAHNGAALIDLSTLASREDLLDCLEQGDLASSPRICVHHFEHRLQDEEHNLLKLELLEELTLGRDKQVIVLSAWVPAWYLLDREPASLAADKASDPEKAKAQERWRRLLRRFNFWVCRDRADAGCLESSLSSIQEKRTLPEGSWEHRRLQRLLAAAREESGDSEQLQKLSAELVRAHLNDLSRDLFIDDLRERAEPYYRVLWAMCTEAEKLTLVQLAEGGLVNAKNASALKMLMRRGLVKRDPSFRIMNESFRRFLAAEDLCLHEVRALEQKAEASAWTRMRGPLTLTLLGVAAFFFATQREAFDISMAFFSALAAGLPALFRVLGTATPGQGKTAA